MGAWGYYPQDSDGALDLQYEVIEAANKQLDKMYNNYLDKHWRHNGGYHFAGLILLLLQKGFWVKYKYIYRALYCIECEIRSTKNGNLSGWNEPDTLIKTATKIAKEFQILLDDEKETYMSKKTKWLKGKSLQYRLSSLNQSKITVYRGFLVRDFQLRKGTSWSGLFEKMEGEAL